jgi:hypothetical protein
LIEVLLAIFILGIGVISIAALFPAGIAQQRRSADDILGPTVADNALEVIRSKVGPDDFGQGVGYTIEGDTDWMRPAVFFNNTTVSDPMNGGTAEISAGSIGIFTRNVPAGDGVDSEVLWNDLFYPQAGAFPDGPLFVITQRERSYPQASTPLSPALLAIDQFPDKPQYYWECMFRRFQGRILTAIFVYRVNLSGGTAIPYSSPPLPSLFGSAERLPYKFALGDLANPVGGWDACCGADGIAGNLDDSDVPNTAPGSAFLPQLPEYGWQAPGQWIIDQNNNVHRVLSGRLTAADGPVQLMRPPPAIPGLPVYFSLPPADGVENIVCCIMYIPTQVELDTDGDGTGDLPVTLTPVYATVKEL